MFYLACWNGKACLPIFLRNNGKLLEKRLREEEFTQVRASFYPYPAEVQDYGILQPFRRSQAAVKEKTLKTRINEFGQTSRELKESGYRISTSFPAEREYPRVCAALNILWKRPRIIALVERTLTKISEGSAILLSFLSQLQRCAEKRFETTPQQEAAREKDLRMVWRHNEEALGTIKELRELMGVMNDDIRMRMLAKNIIINKHLGKVERLKKTSRDDIKKRVYESEKQMITDWKSSEMRKELLRKQVEERENSYYTLLSDDLLSEKELRAKRLKAEAQVISWLNKYDQDIGEKQAEWDEIMDGYDTEKQQMEELQKKFDEQEEEYLELMAEKEAEERAQFEERLYMFTSTRAAHILQRAWRAYWSRKKHQRKRKKGKKKAKN